MGGLSDRPHSHASKPPRSRRHGKSANLGTNESAVATALEPEPEPEPEPKPEPGAGPEPAHATAHTPNVVDQLISSLLDSGRGNGRQRDRRSLSQQLASAVGGADEVMAQYGAGRKPGLIMSAPAERFAVAGCESRGCSVMYFFGDRATYMFAHPMRGRIDMQMYYRNMRNAAVTRASRLFTFRVGRSLRHFADDYVAEDPSHHLTLGFRTVADLDAFTVKIWPLIQAAGVEAPKAMGQ